MIIDAYAHAMPERYCEALAERGIHDHDFVPPYLCDMEARRIFMAPLGDVRSVATPMQLPLGRGLPDDELLELAHIYNNEMAELADKNSDLIVATVAALPLGNFDDTMREAERAVTELGMKGILLPCNFHGIEPGSPEMRPLLRLMAKFDLPIWLHPWPGASSRPLMPDSGGWEMLADTADAMVHFVRSGAFEELPDLKIIVHHGGSYIPFFHNRLRAQYFYDIGREGHPYDPSIPEPDHTIPFAQCEKLRNFYADTAFYGHCTMQIANCISYYGADHVLFGTDFPLPTDREFVPALDSLNDLYLKDETRAKIEHGNIEKLLHL
jgi:aminocarboxymuconate-semialdehyde decarboxylase